MRKHGGTPSRRDKHVTLAAISPPGVARGRFVGGQQSGLAGSKPPPLFTREASSCSSQGRRQGEPWGASPRPSAPTYPPARRCVFAGAGPAAAALTASPFLLRRGGGAGPGGAEGRTRGSPAEVGAGGGGGGAAPPPALGPVWEGGGRGGARWMCAGVAWLKPRGFAKPWVHGLPLGMGSCPRGIMAAF